MLQQLLGGLMDTEKMVKDAIQSSLEDISMELGCNPDEFIIAIKATDDKFNFRCHVMRTTPQGNIWVREIAIKEIIDGEETE